MPPVWYSILYLLDQIPSVELPCVLNAVIECSSCSLISMYGSSSPFAEHQAFDPCNRPKKGWWFESNCEDALTLSSGISPLSIPRALLHFSSNNDDKRRCKRYLQCPREGLRSFRRVQANCMLSTDANHSNESLTSWGVYPRDFCDGLLWRWERAFRSIYILSSNNDRNFSMLLSENIIMSEACELANFQPLSWMEMKSLWRSQPRYYLVCVITALFTSTSRLSVLHLKRKMFQLKRVWRKGKILNMFSSHIHPI